MRMTTNSIMKSMHVMTRDAQMHLKWFMLSHTLVTPFYDDCLLGLIYHW